MLAAFALVLGVFLAVVPWLMPRMWPFERKGAYQHPGVLLRMRPSGGGGAGYYLQAGAQLLSGARSAYGAYKQFNQPSAPSS